MKKIALEAWEKNKDKIRRHIEKYYSMVNPLFHKELFVEEILTIAYGGPDKTKFVKIVYNGGKELIILFKIFTIGNQKPTNFCTKYPILSNIVHLDVSFDEKCYIAQQIVLSAKPIDIANCPREWAEEVIDRKWAGIARYGGIII